MQPSFIKIGGELVGMDALLASVELVQELNQHSWCSVEWRNSPDRRLRVEESLGAPMQVTTRDQSGVEHVIFEGFVLDGRLEYEISGSYRARLLGVTRSYLLDVTPQEAYFRKATLADVASRLTAEDGLTAAVTCPVLPPKNYVQWGQTDFAFLVRLADDHGAWVRPAPQGIEICNEFGSGPELTWRDDEGLLGFRVAARVAQPAFGGAHYNARLMQSAIIDGVQKRPEFFGPSGPLLTAALRESANLPQGYVWTDTRAATEKEYREALERENLRVAASTVTACGYSRNETIRPGDAVSVAGYIETAGKWGVTKVAHNWTPEGYGNEFWCTSSKTWLPVERPPARWMDGAVVARVVDHNDPRGMGRVKIQYDWLEDGATGWVRMLTPYAGADRGFMFMPEIGDEVLVMFEHGDPERPYVVGGLWNGVDVAPRSEFWGGDIETNDVKRIVTKSGHRIQLSDEPSKEAITIATAKLVKVGLLEKADETGRPMLVLHSEGDMFVNAPNGRIHLHSKFHSREVGGGGGANVAPATTQSQKAQLTGRRQSGTVTPAALGQAGSDLTQSEATVATKATTTGSQIDIAFDPAKSTSVKKCSQIAHVQVIQMIADGVPLKPGSYYSGFKYRDATALDDGSYVDHLETMKRPDPQSVGIGGYGKKNGGSSPATFFDAPDTGGGDKGFYDPDANSSGWKKIVYKFEIFAVCMRGDDCGKWYEGLNWEYSKTWEDARDGKHGTSTITKEALTTPSSNFKSAFDKFNKEKKYVPCK